MYPNQFLYACMFSYDATEDLVLLNLHNSGPPRGEGVDNLKFSLSRAQLIAGLDDVSEDLFTKVWPARQEGTKSHPIAREEVRISFRHPISFDLWTFRFPRALVRAWVRAETVELAERLLKPTPA